MNRQQEEELLSIINDLSVEMVRLANLSNMSFSILNNKILGLESRIKELEGVR